MLIIFASDARIPYIVPRSQNGLSQPTEIAPPLRLLVEEYPELPLSLPSSCREHTAGSLSKTARVPVRMHDAARSKAGDPTIRAPCAPPPANIEWTISKG